MSDMSLVSKNSSCPSILMGGGGRREGEGGGVGRERKGESKLPMEHYYLYVPTKISSEEIKKPQFNDAKYI